MRLCHAEKRLAGSSGSGKEYPRSRYALLKQPGRREKSHVLMLLSNVWNPRGNTGGGIVVGTAAAWRLRAACELRLVMSSASEVPSETGACIESYNDTHCDTCHGRPIHASFASPSSRSQRASWAEKVQVRSLSFFAKRVPRRRISIE